MGKMRPAAVSTWLQIAGLPLLLLVATAAVTATAAAALNTPTASEPLLSPSSLAQSPFAAAAATHGGGMRVAAATGPDDGAPADTPADPNAHNELHVFYYFGSCVTLASSLFVICSFIKFKALRPHPSSLIFWRSLSDVVFSLQFIILFSLKDGSDHCNIFSFLFQFSVLASQSWYFMNAVDLLRSMRNPFIDPSASMPMYHLFVWSLSLGTSVLISASKSDSYRQEMQLCWTEMSGQSDSLNWVNWVTFFIPTLFYYFFSIFTVIYAALRLRKGLDQTFATRQAVLRNGIRYVAGFCAYWTFAGIIYGLINLRKSEDVPTGLYDSFAVTIAFRGLIDVTIWIYNQRVHKIYKLWWNGLPHDSPADVGLTASDINRALRSEVLIFSTTGIVLAIEKANMIPASNKLPTESAFYPVGLEPFPREPRNMHSVVELTVGRTDFSARHSSVRRSNGTKTGSQIFKGTSLSSPPMSPSNAGGVAAVAGSGGVDVDASSSSMSPVMMGGDFDSAERGASGSSGSDGGSPQQQQQQETVPFLDYAPQVFRYLRQQFGIDEGDYKRSIQGRTEAMVEKFTEGRGGAFFYFSEDSQYIVKTLTTSEGKFLTKFLPSYVKYMSENPASLLSRFVGFHAITLYNLTIHFMVMQSVFLTNRKIHERYDLKGSTVDRHAAKPKPVRVPSGTVIDPVTGLRRPSSGAGAASMRRRGAFRNVVFKDNDLNRTVRLSARDRDTFLRQVRRDAFFLKSCNIMDYSLLLGVHHTSYQVPALSPTSPRPVSPGSPAAAVAASGGSSGNGTSPVGSSGPPALLALSPPSTGGMLSSADSSFASPNGHGSGAYTNRSSSVWSNASGGGGGLHTSASSVAPAPAGVFQSCDGGVQASIIEGPGIYFFGIIDILQEYNTNKKLEHFAKIYLRCKGSGISAVPPLPYAHRFVRFMADITRSDEEDVVAAQNRGASVSGRPPAASLGAGALDIIGGGGDARLTPLLQQLSGAGGGQSPVGGGGGARGVDDDEEDVDWEAMEAEDNAAAAAAEVRRATIAQKERDEQIRQAQAHARAHSGSQHHRQKHSGGGMADPDSSQLGTSHPSDVRLEVNPVAASTFSQQQRLYSGADSSDPRAAAVSVSTASSSMANTLPTSRSSFAMLQHHQPSQQQQSPRRATSSLDEQTSSLPVHPRSDPSLPGLAGMGNESTATTLPRSSTGRTSSAVLFASGGNSLELTNSVLSGSGAPIHGGGAGANFEQR